MDITQQQQDNNQPPVAPQVQAPVVTPPDNREVMNAGEFNKAPANEEFDFAAQNLEAVDAQFGTPEQQAEAAAKQQQEQQQVFNYGDTFKDYATQNNIPLKEDADFSSMTKEEFFELMGHTNQQQQQSNLHPDIAQLNEYVSKGGRIEDYMSYKSQHNQAMNMDAASLYKAYELDPLVQQGHMTEETAASVLRNMDKSQIEIRAAKIKEGLQQQEGQIIQKMNYEQQQYMDQQHQAFVPQLNTMFDKIDQQLSTMDDYYGVPMSEALRKDYVGQVREMFTPKDPYTPTQYDQLVHALQSGDPQSNQIKLDVLFAYHLLRSGKIKGLLSNVKESTKQQIENKLGLNPILNQGNRNPSQQHQQSQSDVDSQWKY
jgi:hypothetical protein